MVQPKYNPQEALERAKLLMSYDSSKTLTENKEVIEEQNIGSRTAIATGAAAGTAAAAGAGIAAAGGATGALGAAAYTSMGVGTSLGATSVVGATALGAGVIAGAAALALTPLVLWYMDKDNAKAKVERMFKYCVTDQSKIKKIPRVVTDAQIRDFSDQLYDAMQGVGTDEEKVYAVFRALQSVSDFCALVVRFNGDQGADLLEWLDDDFDQTSEWNEIYRPLRNVVEDNLRDMADEEIVQDCTQNPNQEKCKQKPVPPVPPKRTGYRDCVGVYKYGCIAPAIGQVQACLGLTADNKFGPNTQAALAKLGYQQFTDADINKICKKPVTPPSPSDEFDTDVDAEDVSNILNQ